MVVTTSFDSALDIVVVLDDFHGASELQRERVYVGFRRIPLIWELNLLGIQAE